MMDNDVCELPKIQATTLFNFSRLGDRPQFLKAIYKDGTVSILEGQSSAMQQSFAISNALVYLPETIFKIEIGDSVETILLPI
jgi:molybdopterin molybdotransferase